MADDDQLRLLRIALTAVGVIFVAAIYPLMIIWPSGWAARSPASTAWAG